MMCFLGGWVGARLGGGGGEYVEGKEEERGRVWLLLQRGACE